MKVLVCGASGFIGRAICKRLTTAGHEVLRGVRVPTTAGDVVIDFQADTSPDKLEALLTGIDAVVNVVGIFAETHTSRFDMVHFHAPVALFDACVKAGVKRVVQISALGADIGTTGFLRSKRAADRHLMELPLEWQILRPSLVYGDDGASASLFRAMASLPVIPVPALEGTEFQPIHIDDLADAVVRSLDPQTPARQLLPLVGSCRVSFRALLGHYRRAMGFGPARYLILPKPMISVAATLGGLLPGAMLTPESWRMLQGGSADDAAPLTRLLGRAPQPIEAFIPTERAELLRLRALTAWRLPLLRHVLAIVWLVTALISAFVYPVTGSLAMLAKVGLTGPAAKLALYGASVFDGLMGIACLHYPTRLLWATQVGLILGYTAIIAVALPEFLIHPFGPVLKNLPILAILFILYAESEPWTT